MESAHGCCPVMESSAWGEDPHAGYPRDPVSARKEVSGHLPFLPGPSYLNLVCNGVTLMRGQTLRRNLQNGQYRRDSSSS